MSKRQWARGKLFVDVFFAALRSFPLRLCVQNMLRTEGNEQLAMGNGQEVNLPCALNSNL